MTVKWKMVMSTSRLGDRGSSADLSEDSKDRRYVVGSRS